MIEIIQLHGTDRKLYTLVAPLVMNPEVLKQNYNYPFRTSEQFEWFIAVEKRHVAGFVPVECRRKEAVINNYYIKGKEADTLRLLLEKVVETLGEENVLAAVAFREDKSVFADLGFVEEKAWTRYVRMKKDD